MGPQSRQWHMPLPTGRGTIDKPDSPTGGPTYGHYFTAIQSYLQNEGWADITEATDRILKRPVNSWDIQNLNIHLVKHGALYHPALVTVKVNDDSVRLALNVAVSVQGHKVIRCEYDSLCQLTRDYQDSFIPEVYGYGQGRPGDGQPAMEMFLAQWFDGYCEFHISGTEQAGYHWRIWDDDHGHRPLTAQQVAEAYRQSARILTYYLNPISFEAVLDWHPAAGDFVLRPTAQGVEVRLITIRRYAPFLQWQEPRSPSLEALLEALTWFLLRTSLWLRLDRLDGVGELVWADGVVLSAIWQGFVHGLNAMIQAHDLPDELATATLTYIAAHSNHQMNETGARMVDQWTIAVPEKKLIGRHLSTHIDGLMDIIRTDHPGAPSNGLMTP